MLIEIKNWQTKDVIFSYDCEDNTIKKTVEKAVQRGVNLSNADLRLADLSGADLRKANLSFAELRLADLSGADLREANLSFADIYHANLSHADISYANLYFAILNGADLNGADLSYTDLIKANLYHANLSSACLYCAEFYRADLRFTNLSSSNLNDVNLRFAILNCANISNAKINYPMNIPDGEFIGWKKIYSYIKQDYVIVKLKILSDSKRSRATSDKCRCDKAMVLGFETLKGEQLDIKEVTNYNYTQCTYKAGEIVYADWWDDNRWNECSHGIHFFLDRQSAVEY